MRKTAMIPMAAPPFMPRLRRRPYIVYGPHREGERSAIGAPIEDVSISRPVRYDDLDLRTDRGVHELKRRILHTADGLCRRLDVVYPGRFYPPTSDNLPCRQTVIEDAMEQADAAIARERGYAD